MYLKFIIISKLSTYWYTYMMIFAMKSIVYKNCIVVKPSNLQSSGCCHDRVLALSGVIRLLSVVNENGTIGV